MTDTKSLCAAGVLELDGELCTFCEICLRHCPTDAFRFEWSAGEVQLFFTPALCTGCADEESCESACPEKAIRLLGVPEAGAPDGELLLAQSKLVHCSYCGERFAPLRKLEALAQEGRIKHAPVRDLCPVCRRKHLVVRFIEEKRLPGEKAEYRSGTDILRRAGYGPDSPKSQG